MSKLGEIVSRAGHYLLIGGMSGAIVVMAGYSIAARLVPPTDPMWENIRCYLNIPFNTDERCFQKRVSALEAQWKGLVEQGQIRLAALTVKEREAQEARGALDAKLRELQAIEDQVTEFSLFTKRSYTMANDVHTGVGYKSFVRERKWTSAWCYWKPPRVGSVEIHFDMARATPETGIKWETFSDTALREAGVTRDQLEAAKKHCVWPAGLS